MEYSRVIPENPFSTPLSFANSYIIRFNLKNTEPVSIAF
uniref:Uncharacterized protein n=1 Tax=Arundo donax TaxID=35708 RepID=A0A0A8Y072_ARUDO